MQGLFDNPMNIFLLLCADSINSLQLETSAIPIYVSFQSYLHIGVFQNMKFEITVLQLFNFFFFGSLAISVFTKLAWKSTSAISILRIHCILIGNINSRSCLKIQFRDLVIFLNNSKYLRSDVTVFEPHLPT